MKPINQYEEVLEKFGELQKKALTAIYQIRNEPQPIQDAQLYRTILEFHYFTRTMLERLIVFQCELEPTAKKGGVIRRGKHYQRA